MYSIEVLAFLLLYALLDCTFFTYIGGGGEEESLKNQDLNIKHENGYQFCRQKWASSELLKQVLWNV